MHWNYTRRTISCLTHSIQICCEIQKKKKGKEKSHLQFIFSSGVLSIIKTLNMLFRTNSRVIYGVSGVYFDPLSVFIRKKGTGSCDVYKYLYGVGEKGQI